MQMYDFAKMRLPSYMRETLLSNDLLDFGSVFSRKTGEIKHKLISFYPTNETNVDKRWTFTINGNYIELKGSFHKYCQGGTNYAVYSFSDFINTVNDLKAKFAIDPRDVII